MNPTFRTEAGTLVVQMPARGIINAVAFINTLADVKLMPKAITSMKVVLGHGLARA